MGTFTDPRDGKTYKTVTIGKQTWMAENLNYDAPGSKCFGEGGIVTEMPDNPYDPPIRKPISNAEIQANCEKYGRLYDWETAKKLCPPGWHLPSDAEWQELVNFAGGEKIAGKKLKANSGWVNNGNGTDEYGFAALPGGACGSGKFVDVGSYGTWWTSTEFDGSLGLTDAKSWKIFHDKDNVTNSGNGIKTTLRSVRYVKD